MAVFFLVTAVSFLSLMWAFIFGGLLAQKMRFDKLTGVRSRRRAARGCP